MTAAARSIPEILKTALARLQTENRSTSIRSIAALIGRSPSYVSKLFRGERTLPLKQVPALAKVLQLDVHETAEVQRLLLAQVEESQLQDATGIRTVETPRPEGIANFDTLGASDFWLLDQWYYIPLLNLVTTADFQNSPEWIAQRLGTHPTQAKLAVERLLAAGHLAANDQGQLVRTNIKMRFPTQRSHARVRDFHRAMIERALVKLRAPPTEKEFSERLVSGVTLAVDPSKIAEAKVILEEAAYRAVDLLTSGSCTEVFQLNLQLFGLTKAAR